MRSPAAAAAGPEEVLLLAVGRGGLPAGVPLLLPGGVQPAGPGPRRPDRGGDRAFDRGELPARGGAAGGSSRGGGGGRRFAPGRRGRAGPGPVGGAGAGVAFGSRGPVDRGAGRLPAGEGAGGHGGEIRPQRVRVRGVPLPLCAGVFPAEDLHPLRAGATAAGARAVPRERPHPAAGLPHQAPGVPAAGHPLVQSPGVAGLSPDEPGHGDELR